MYTNTFTFQYFHYAYLALITVLLRNSTPPSRRNRNTRPGPPPPPPKQKRQLFGKYLKSGPTQLDFIPEQLIKDMHECIEQARDDKAILGLDLFLEVQKACFRQIFDKTFMRLKTDHAER